MSMLSTQRDTISKRGGIVALGILVMTAIFAIALSPVSAFADETIDIPVTTNWIDNDNELNNRPDSVTYKLYAVSTDGATTLDNGFTTYTEPGLVATQDATKEDGYATTFLGMPTHDDGGSELKYMIGREVIPCYQGNGICYLHDEETGRYRVHSSWCFDGTPYNVDIYRVGYNRVFRSMIAWDDEGHEGERPETIGISLLANDEVVDEMTLSNDDFTTGDLTTYLNGALAAYADKTVWARYFWEDGHTDADPNPLWGKYPMYRNGELISYAIRVSDPINGYECVSEDEVFISDSDKGYQSILLLRCSYVGEQEESEEANDSAEDPKAETPAPKAEEPTTPATPTTPAAPTTPRPIEKREIPQLGAELPVGTIVIAGIFAASVVGYMVSRRMRH